MHRIQIEKDLFDDAALQQKLQSQSNPIEVFKQQRKHYLDILTERFNSGRAATELIYLHAALTDKLLSLVWPLCFNEKQQDGLSLVAVGGYGRGTLAPGSDIDLLFLLPYKQTAWGESVVEYMLYLLWDLGFKVGHATRTVPQSVKLAQADMTIRTSLLDARLILGDEALFGELLERFQGQVVAGSSREFIAAKLEERDARHTRSGASRYLVEPNVKDGKGGLRDLHTLYWLARYLHPEKAIEEFVEAGIFSHAEYETFQRCEDFLLTVRCHLHFLTGRPDERLFFDLQTAMAERLGYREHKGQRPVDSG